MNVDPRGASGTLPLPCLEAVTVDTGRTTFWQAATAAGDVLSSRTLAPSLAAVDQAWLDRLLGVGSDDRYVAFMSSAPNLVPGDANTESNIVVRDRGQE